MDKCFICHFPTHFTLIMIYTQAKLHIVLNHNIGNKNLQYFNIDFWQKHPVWPTVIRLHDAEDFDQYTICFDLYCMELMYNKLTLKITQSSNQTMIKVAHIYLFPHDNFIVTQFCAASIWLYFMLLNNTDIFKLLSFALDIYVAEIYA